MSSISEMKLLLLQECLMLKVCKTLLLQLVLQWRRWSVEVGKFDFLGLFFLSPFFLLLLLFLNLLSSISFRLVSQIDDDVWNDIEFRFGWQVVSDSVGRRFGHLGWWVNLSIGLKTNLLIAWLLNLGFWLMLWLRWRHVRLVDVNLISGGELLIVVCDLLIGNPPQVNKHVREKLNTRCNFASNGFLISRVEDG